MYEKLAKISIRGRCFNQTTTLDLFCCESTNNEKKPKIVRGALLYGKNGSGKSTIGKAFSKIAGDNDTDILDADLLDESGKKLNILSNIHVFNERFIYKNVSIQTEQLKTIVMFGEAVELEDRLKNVERELNDAKKEVEDCEKKYTEKKKEVDSLKSKIDDKLRSGWAERERVIKGTRQNPPIRIDTYKQFEFFKLGDSKPNYLKEYAIKKRKLDERLNNTIEPKVPEIDPKYCTFDDETFIQLVNKKIDKPELTEREKRILDLSSDDIISRKQVFNNESVKYCPFCLQELKSEYKQELINSIEKVFSRELDDFLNEIKKYKLPKIEIDLSQYKNLNSYSKCIEIIEKINCIIDNNNQHIQDKYDNPHNIINLKNSEFKITISELNGKLNDLENERLEYNDKTSIDNLRINLEDVNKSITCLELKSLIAKYKKNIRKNKKLEGKLKELITNKEDKDKEYQKLQSKIKNVYIASDVINDNLSYIFCSKDRLSIKFENNGYCVYSYGKIVTPNALSTGEINAMALSYFFASIMENRDKTCGYEEEYLLIIDDPVSSFSFENRIGILSFIRYQLSKFIEGNNNTKVLIMTHDLQTMFDLQKVFGELINVAKNKFAGIDSVYNQLELKNFRIERFINKHNEYTESLNTMYKFAFEDCSDYELYIGNIARQTLEAFSTFNYKKSIDEISNDKEIIGKLPSEYQVFYENYMFRIVLNGLSHKAEQIKSMGDYNFFSTCPHNEKVNTIKTILCFIYLLNDVHLLKHLEGCKDVKKNLDNWLKSIELKS